MPLGKRRFTTGNISITSGIEFYWEHNNFCGITAICMGDGAVEWIRTTTVLLPPAPQAGASASSATTAQWKRLYCSRASQKRQGTEKSCSRITLWSAGALLPLLTLQIHNETSGLANNCERKSASPAATLQKVTASREPMAAALKTAVPQAVAALEPVSREPVSPPWARALSTSPGSSHPGPPAPHFDPRAPPWPSHRP